MKKSILLLVLLTAAVACKKDEWSVVSERPKHEIKIDGDAGEWENDLRFDDDATVGYAISNDDHYLYLCIKSNKEIFHQIMRGGLMIWFDSTAQAKKILGIKYPLGMQNMGPGSRPEPMDLESSQTRASMDQRHMALFGEMEILGPEKEDVNRASAQNSFGIKAAIGGMPDDPAYELQIPLQTAKGVPYAIAAAPGAIISLGIESGKIKKMMRGGGPGGPGGGRGPGGGGGRPGGMGPDGGGSGGGMGPGGGMGRGDGPPPGLEDDSASSDPIKLWLKVQLAK